MSRFSTSNFEIVIAGFFLALVVATGLVDVSAPVEPPKLIGNERHRDAKMRRDARWSDGSRARLVEHDLRLTSRVRRIAGSYYAYALYRYLDEAQGRLLVGHDNWLFMRARTLMPARDNQALAQHSAALMAAVEQRAAALGVRLVLLPVPRKSVVYRQHLPPRVDSEPVLDEVLIAELLDRGVETVDLLKAFRRHRELRPEDHLYFQADSHWTDRAQLIAAQQACRTAGILVPVEERASRLVSRGLQPAPIDQLRYIGLHVPQQLLDDLGLAEIEALDVVAQNAQGAAPHKGGLTLTGTSFSTPRKLASYLEHFSGRRVRNAARAGAHPIETLTTLLAEREKPELLVFEIPGHNVIGRFPLFKIADFFAATPIPDSAARFVLRQLETDMEPDRWTKVRGRLDVASLPPGNLLHSADGILSLHLAGEVREGKVGVFVEHAGETMSTTWPKGRSEVFLPLVSGRPTQGELRVAFKGRTSVRVDAAELVAVLAIKSAVKARGARVRATAHGWRQRFEFRHKPRVERHSALLVTLDFAGSPEGFTDTNLELFVRTGRGRGSTWELGALEKRSQVLVHLNGLRGEDLSAVELRGSGAAPRRAVRRVVYLPSGS